jgi:Zn-dependent M16 (insulinase) family peptidase
MQGEDAMSPVSDDFLNLLHRLCEGREMPILVTDLIAERLVHRNLFSINKLSRSLSIQANNIIYRDVAVELDGSKESVEKASLLFRTLLTCDSAVHAVRALSHCLVTLYRTGEMRLCNLIMAKASKIHSVARRHPKSMLTSQNSPKEKSSSTTRS